VLVNYHSPLHRSSSPSRGWPENNIARGSLPVSTEMNNSSGHKRQVSYHTRKVSNFVAEEDRNKALHLTIHCATWNVGASMPSTSDIAKVLELKNEYPDIYCIGLQEVVDLNVLNVAIRPNHAADRWERMIERVLDSKYNPHHKHANEGFSKICVQQMVGLLLLVYIRADLFPYVSEFQTDSLGDNGAAAHSCWF